MGAQGIRVVVHPALGPGQGVEVAVDDLLLQKGMWIYRPSGAGMGLMGIPPNTQIFGQQCTPFRAGLQVRIVSEQAGDPMGKWPGGDFQ